jgi:hypothetical protein
MRGGKRNGAGRKVIPDSEKKKRRSIYITEDLYDKIMETILMPDSALHVHLYLLLLMQEQRPLNGVQKHLRQLRQDKNL